MSRKFKIIIALSLLIPALLIAYFSSSLEGTWEMGTGKTIRTFRDGIIYQNGSKVGTYRKEGPFSYFRYELTVIKGQPVDVKGYINIEYGFWGNWYSDELPMPTGINRTF